MKYYKFPDYTLEESKGSEWISLENLFRNNTAIFSSKLCEKGSNQLIVASQGRAENQIRMDAVSLDPEYYPRSSVFYNDILRTGTAVVSLLQLDKLKSDESVLVAEWKSREIQTLDDPEKFVSEYLQVSNKIFIIKYDSDNRPSVIAVPLETFEDIQDVKTNSRKKIILAFFKINHIRSTIEKLDQELEFKLNNEYYFPYNVIGDIDNNILFVSFDNNIFAYDMTDETDLSLLAEYSFDDPNRDNRIGDMIYDNQNSIIICNTRNNYLYYDLIAFLFYDKVNNSFVFRNTFNRQPTNDYNSLFLYQNKIFTVNVNGYDLSGNDTLRSDVGLKILETTNNYQNVQVLNSIAFGSYWNDDEMRLADADMGYKLRDQKMHYKILDIRNDKMYVLCCTKGENNVDGDDILIYDIENSPTIDTIGSTQILSSVLKRNPDFMNLFLLDEDTVSGKKFIIGSSVTQLNVSLAYWIDSENISLLQEIALDDIPYDTDIFIGEGSSSDAGSLLAVANGERGAKIFYFDSNRNKYSKLLDIRPKDEEDNYVDIYSVDFYGLSINQCYLICGGNDHLFLYRYELGKMVLIDTFIMSRSLGTIGENIESGVVRFLRQDGSNSVQERLLNFAVEYKTTG